MVCSITKVQAEDLELKISLKGEWKFTIGDDPAWAEMDYNDQDWDEIFVPRNWESSGFKDYNGFAWYRKDFQLPDQLDKSSLFLILGRIDDVDEVYLNGQLIGASGVFPPAVITAYHILRKYPFPEELLNSNGKNVIAIRVFDDYNDGGICAGPIGIYVDKDNELLSYNLSGYWNFEARLNKHNTRNNFYHQKGSIYVPGFWESFGYPQFDGTAIYSTQFMLPSNFDEENIMLVLGYIDDMEKVYLNDVLIGTTDDLRNKENRNISNIHILRGYQIPKGIFVKGGQNTLIVKVYDTGGEGGIYAGPVGLITNENYVRLKNKRPDTVYDFWDSFFRAIFE